MAARWTAIACTVVAVVSASGCPGQRSARGDAQRSVFRAFPSADGYQVIEQSVALEARRAVESRLPFRVHYSELGRHTLYVALRGRRPLGMVYKQREASAFGLASVEWALTFDLRIRSLNFRRTRSPHRRLVERSPFVRSLSGKGRAELSGLLDEHGQLRTLPPGMPEDARGLVAAIVRSAIKAQTVLAVVWQSQVDHLHDFAIGLDAFPRTDTLRRLWPPSRDRSAPSERSPVAFAVRYFDPNGRELGLVADVAVGNGRAAFTARWTFDEHDVLQRVEVDDAVPQVLRARCRELVGKPLEQICGDRSAIGSALRPLRELITTAPAPGR